MIGTIDLYKLAFTPNDTMYFDSTFSQNEWFDAQEHLSIENISFNGDRAFKLPSNYLDIIFNYNYIRYKLNDRYIYAFIENVTYNNDNTSSLNISIDLNQTFLQELQTAISTSNLGNVTKKDSEFINNYIPYDNKIPVPDYNYNFLSNLAVEHNNFVLGFIFINVDPNIIQNNLPYLRDNGFVQPVKCLMLPVLYNKTNKRLYTEFASYFKYNSSDTEDRIFSGFRISLLQELFPNLIADNCVSINFNSKLYCSSMNVTWFEDADYVASCHIVGNNYSDQLSVQTLRETDLYKLLTLGNNNYFYTFSVDLAQYLDNIPYALYRQPYIYLRVGNDNEYFTISLLDFKNPNNNTTNKILEIKCFNSGTYPFTTNFSFKFNNCEITNKNAMFNCMSSIPVPFSLSAWQEYYSMHSASVNDGLATQQKYGRIEDITNLGTKLVNTAIGMQTSAIPYTKAGNFYKKPHKPTDRSIVSGSAGAVTEILNAGIEYSNSEFERQKERALLSISWNDIQSSPSAYSNIMSNLPLFYANGFQGIEIDLCIARNINDIIKYHKQYGYKVNRMEKLTWQNIKQHTVFDYISFNTITLKSTLPQSYTAMIEQQYEQGVRFWYDYNNFMNYEIENEEL